MTDRHEIIDAEIEFYRMDEATARRLTERIRLTAHNARDAIEKLQELVEEAKHGNAHEVLGYSSWTAYLSDVLGSEPLRLPRDQRRELVGYLAGEQQMSTRAIAPILGVDPKTIVNDIKDIEAGGDRKQPTITAENSPVVRTKVIGRNGQVYKADQNHPNKDQVRRAPLKETAHAAGWRLAKATERLERVAADDRLAANKEAVATLLRDHLNHAIEVCQDLLDRIDHTTD